MKKTNQVTLAVDEYARLMNDYFNSKNEELDEECDRLEKENKMNDKTAFIKEKARLERLRKKVMKAIAFCFETGGSNGCVGCPYKNKTGWCGDFMKRDCYEVLKNSKIEINENGRTNER